METIKDIGIVLCILALGITAGAIGVTYYISYKMFKNF